MNDNKKQDLFMQIQETGFFNQLLIRNLFLDFINSFKDLKSMKSTDGRPQYKNAEVDIHQHFIMNNDWDLVEVFSSKVGLFSDDILFEKFLLAVVASKYSDDPELTESLVRLINQYLHLDSREFYLHGYGRSFTPRECPNITISSASCSCVQVRADYN